MGLSKSDMDLVILGILMGAPLHGYMIKQSIESSYGDRYFKLSNSALYPALARLEQDGYIEGKRELQESVPDRKVYHITESGKKRLIELVATPIDPSSSLGATDYSFKVHAVHFGFITKEQRRNVTKPLYDDAKLELKEALEKQEKFGKDFEKFNEYIKQSGQDTEQFKVLRMMSQLPLVVLEEGIEELKNKVRFYERIMELG